MKKIIILIYFYTNALTSQVQYAGSPLSFNFLKYDYKSGYEFSYISSDSLLKEENERKNQITPDLYSQKIGIKRECNINFIRECQLDSFDDEYIATFKIKSKGATSIKLLFENLKLSNSAKIYVFDVNRRKYFGSFTKNIETETGENCIRSFYNDEIIIELNCKKNEFISNKIIISGIGHNFYNSKDYKRSLPCHNNVNCNQYDDWCNEIRSVVKIEYYQCCANPDDGSISSIGFYVGTAVLYATTSNNSRRLLTNFHNIGCIRNDDRSCVDFNTRLMPHYNDAILYFNFQSPFCFDQDPDLDDDYTLNGGFSVVGECFESDQAVIETQKEIPLQYNYYYSGWDIRSFNENENKDITIIGHPGGDIKKITFAEWQNPYNYRQNYYDFILGFFYKGVLKSGVVEQGSSGSPVFNIDHKIVGTVSHGVPKPSCDNTWFNFGKLNTCFDGQGTLIRNGIDPVRSCLNYVNLNGLFCDARKYRDVKHNIKIQSNYSTIGNLEDSEFRDNSNFTITAQDEIFITGNVGNVKHTTNPLLSKNYQDAELEFYTAPCEYSTEQCGFNYFKLANSNNNPVTIENKLFDLSLHPNPTTQNSTLTLIGYKDRKANILVLDQTGKIIFTKNISQVENEKTEVEIESQNWSKGIYIIRVECQENTKAIKLVKE